MHKRGETKIIQKYVLHKLLCFCILEKYKDLLYTGCWLARVLSQKKKKKKKKGCAGVATFRVRWQKNWNNTCPEASFSTLYGENSILHYRLWMLISGVSLAKLWKWVPSSVVELACCFCNIKLLVPI